MIIFVKITDERWDIILRRIVFVSLVIAISIDALPVQQPDKAAVPTTAFTDKIIQGVLSANLKSIVQREYARYFNTSWINRTDDLTHECLLGPSAYYLWWLDSFGSVRPGLNTKTTIALDLSYKNLSERNLTDIFQSVAASSDKNHV